MSLFRHSTLIAMGLCTIALLPALTQAENLKKATFAGGCFWCMEPPYDELEGVKSTVSGYANGHVKNPSYKQVTQGGTGHIEAMQVTYDADQISYETLLEVFWANIDPVDDGGQFCDRGPTYRTAIFYHNDSQAALAKSSKQALTRQFELAEPVVTPIEKLTAFYPAEEYHQDFYDKNPIRYKYYRFRCGRDARLQELWGERPKLNLSPPEKPEAKDRP